MKKRIAALVLALLLTALPLTSLAGTFQEKRDLLIDGTRIAAVAGSIEPENGWEVIDAAGRLVTPGIIAVSKPSARIRSIR